MYAFGDDVTVLDAYLGEYITTISLPGNTQSLQMEFNPVNNYLYCVSKKIIYAVDPLLNTVVKSMTFSNIISDVKINTSNGDIYVTYENVNDISIYSYNNTLSTTLSNSTTGGKMVFNTFEADMYVIGLNEVKRVDGPTRTIPTIYGIVGATSSIFYEPVNEAIYVYGSSTLWKIDNGITSSITNIAISNSHDLIYNNITGQMNLSDDSTSFRAFDLSTDTISVNNYIGNYGYLSLNQYDGSIYLSSKSSNAVIVVNPINGSVTHTEVLGANSEKVIYNPERKSI
jgi:hypothetical protein